MNHSLINQVIEKWKEGPKPIDKDDYHKWVNRLSSSFIKSFWDCEYKTILKYVLNNPVQEEKLTADQEIKKKAPEWEAVGKFVEAYVFSGEDAAGIIAEDYKNNFFNQVKMYKKIDGVLTDTGIRIGNSTYDQAITCAKAVLDEPKFMEYIRHEHSTFHETFEFDIDGVPFKAETDCLNVSIGYELDFKTSADIDAKTWSNTLGKKVGFIKAYEYGTQRAIYRHAIYQKYGVLVLPMIGAVSKQAVPAKRLYEFKNTELLDALLIVVQESLSGILEVLEGEREPNGCGVCDYCKRDSQISGVYVVPDEEY